VIALHLHEVVPLVPSGHFPWCASSSRDATGPRLFARIACLIGKRTRARPEDMNRRTASAGMKRPRPVHSDVMARTNDEVAALFSEYADLISITGGDAYKARVYEKAARSVGGHHADVSTLDAKGLQEIPNVGRSIAEKI